MTAMNTAETNMAETNTARLNAKIPAGPIAEKWDTYKSDMKLVNPNNKRKFKIIVVGSGLAGASAAASLAELGYQVDVFTFHDSPRRAHSIAAQGGINAAKNYHGDGDSIHRLFYDTVKGGDFRAREGNVYRLAQVSVDIIDQMVAQGVPFAREYGGLLDNRSFGGAQVSRTFYARGQTGQQLLLGAYHQLARQIGLGNVRLFNRSELVDTVTIDGRCAGIVTRDLQTGDVQSHAAHATVLCTGGYGNLFEMYERIAGENPYDVPMRIYPASHYTMGGLWVDYELMTTIPGLYAAGEANFSDHGANRLGASALMQGLADGYFVLPYTIGNYLAPMLNKPMPGTDHPDFKTAEHEARQRYQRYLDTNGTRSPDWFHRKLGKVIWDHCGMERTEAGLQKALTELPPLYEEFQKDLRVTGDGTSVNQTLEKAGRVDDFFQLGMLMCRDALERKESCGGHFRAEYQDDEGEAQRDDEHFAHVAAWEWTGDPMKAIRNVEELDFETIHLAKRSYK